VLCYNFEEQFLRQAILCLENSADLGQALSYSNRIFKKQLIESKTRI